MRHKTENDTMALQMQLLKAADYENLNTTIKFDDGSECEITPAMAKNILGSFYNLRPWQKYVMFRGASCGREFFETLFCEELDAPAHG